MNNGRPSSRESTNSLNPTITSEAQQPTFSSYYGGEPSTQAVNPFMPQSINSNPIHSIHSHTKKSTLGTVSEEAELNLISANDYS